MSHEGSSSESEDQIGDNDYLKKKLAQLAEESRINEEKINAIKEKIRFEENAVSALELNIARLEEKEKEKERNGKSLQTYIQHLEKRVTEIKARNDQAKLDNEAKLKNMREQQNLLKAHLKDSEDVFCKLYDKYDKSKNAILVLKSNNEVLSDVNLQLRDTVIEQELIAGDLESHANEQMEAAKSDIEGFEYVQQAENSRLKALAEQTQRQTMGDK